MSIVRKPQNDGKPRWQARVHLGGNRYTSRTFRTKVDAERWEREQATRLDRGEPVATVAKARETVGSYATRWHESRRNRLKANTFANEASRLNWLTAPPLGDVPLSRVTTADVRSLILRMEDAGLSNYYRADVLGDLGQALRRATREGLVGTNPMDGLERGERPKQRREKPMRPLEVDEVGLLVNVLDDLDPTGTSGLIVTTAVQTGMRWEELAGLRAKYLDLDRGTVRVQEVVVEVSGRLEFSTEPKSASSARTISLPGPLVDRLRGYNRAIGDGLVFTTPSGSPLRASNWRRRQWNPAAAQLADPRPTFHDLRHTHASQLVREGVPITTVAARLGHESPATTLRLYSHLMVGMDDAAADAMAKLYGPSNARTMHEADSGTAGTKART